MTDIKPRDSWVVRELEFGWTDCVEQGGDTCVTEDEGILSGPGCSYWWKDSPTALFYDSDGRRNNSFVRSFYHWVDEDAGHDVEGFCRLKDVNLPHDHRFLEAGRPNWLKYRDTSAVAPYSAKDYGCSTWEACTFELQYDCFMGLANTEKVIAPSFEVDIGTVQPAGAERVQIGDGCAALQFRHPFERRVTVTKTGYDDTYKRQCCMGEIANDDVRCDPAWRVDDPEGQCSTYFVEECFVQQPEPCGRALMFNDEPWAPDQDNDPAAVNDTADGLSTRRYCRRYMNRMRAIMGGLMGSLSSVDAAKVDAFQSAMLQYCQGPGFGYGECACVNGVLPCHNPFQPVADGDNDPQQSGQECVMMDHPRNGGASRRFQLTRSEFTESKTGQPIRNAGGVDVQALPTHCWAPACNRSGRCMFRDYLSDREPCPSVCAQYVDQENISVKSITGAKGVYIGNHVLTCNLGNSDARAMFAPDPTSIQAEITEATATDVQNGTITVTFVDADQTHSSQTLDAAATFISSVAAEYVTNKRAPVLQDVVPTLGTFRALSTLATGVAIHPDDVEQHVSSASPTATVRYSIDNSKFAKPVISTYFAVDIVLRDVTGANADVVVPLNLWYNVD